MMPLQFDSEADLPPIPFDERNRRLAGEMKNADLTWKPHVGCFVWDPDHHIQPASPFPNRVYFILSLKRFIDLMGSGEAIADKLVWLPTWHQARLICRRLGISDAAVSESLHKKDRNSPGEELAQVYLLIIDALQSR